MMLPEFAMSVFGGVPSNMQCVLQSCEEREELSKRFYQLLVHDFESEAHHSNSLEDASSRLSKSSERRWGPSS